MTRGAAAKILCNLILGPTAASALVADAAPYSDVPTDNVFAGYIAYCQKTGIISGYADGTFRPAASLTGYAFMKMLLGALGYESANEGYTGANWSINVAKQAIAAGLNAGLLTDFNGVKAVTREEACLYAFNTLKATMVEYDTQTIVIDNGSVSTNKVAKDMANTARTETIEDDDKMQFAEKYFTKLEKEMTTDDFGRPSNKWTYKNNDIGTFVDYSLMVAEYTTAVSGKEVYNAIGKTAMDKYDLYSFADGNTDKDILKSVAKDNKNDVTGSGNGVLTQVFVSDDTKEVMITEINTYLGIADADYSEKKDEATFDVYGLSKEGKIYTKVAFNADGTLATTHDMESVTVSGEDFDVSDVKEDDAYLFTVAAGSVQSFVPATVVSDTEITSFKIGSNVTAEGTKYSFNEAAYYDNDVLKAYTDGSGTINLKDTTYNIYLDAYGYLLGLDKVDEVFNYVFVTGADQGSSNLATKTTDANVIFMDGTSKVIEVSTTKGDGASVTGAIINKWYSYSVDKNGVYTLKNISVASGATTTFSAGKVAQYHQAPTGDDTVKIDKKNVSLSGGTTDYAYVYGKADTVYLTAEVKKVVNGSNYAVISGVENVTTGVKNASIETLKAAKVASDAKVTAQNDNSNISYGVYTLYKDNGYVVAAVVVGDDAASSKNLVYVNSSKVEMESYDKTEDEWTWTRKVINAEGQEVELTEKSDSLTYIGTSNMTQGEWYQVKYDANGYVVDAKTAASQLDNGTEYINTFAAIEAAVNAKDTVLLERGKLNKAKTLSLKGSTLFDDTEGARGVAVDDDTNIVFIQTNDNKETTSIDSGVKALENALKNLNIDEGSNKYAYEFSAILEDGVATTVVIRDLVKDGYTANVVGSSSLKNAAISKAADGKMTASWTDDGSYNGKTVIVTFYQVVDGKSYVKEVTTGTASSSTTHSQTTTVAISQTGDYYAVIEIVDANGDTVAETSTATVGFAF